MLDATDAITPREFLKLFADVIGEGTHYEPVKILAGVIKEFADENPDVTWLHAIYIVDYTYTIITVLSFTMEFKNAPNTPVSTIINSILHRASRDPVLCRLFLPIVDYIKQNAPEFAVGVPCTCP